MTVTLDTVAAELVSLQPDGSELPLGPATESLVWGEQTGDLTVTVSATLQNVEDVGDGRDLWTALGGDGGRYRIDVSTDGGQTIHPAWEGSAWRVRLHSTGRDAIEVTAYDDLRTTLTDEAYYVGPNSLNGEAANSWIQRVLGDGGPAATTIAQPTQTITQYIFPPQPRGQTVDQILRWAFLRTPSWNPDGSPNPAKVPYLLQMRLLAEAGPGAAGSTWAATTVAAGANQTVYAFDETVCAEVTDDQSIEDLVRQVSIYSSAALVQGTGDVSLNPYAAALSAGLQTTEIQDSTGLNRFAITETNPRYVPPPNLGPLRRLIGGGGADNPTVLAQTAQDLLTIYGTPWKVRTVVVPFCPDIRRGDAHHFQTKTLNDYYVVTGVSHNYGRRVSVLTLDSSGVIGRRVQAQAFLGVQGSGTATGDPGTGDTAGGAPRGAGSAPLGPAAAGAVAAATDPQVQGKPYVFGGSEGRTRMDAANAFSSTDCLAIGTLVLTEHGEIPVERLRPGVRVWTRAGLRRLLAVWLKRERAETIRVKTNYGAILQTTPGHRVWVVGNGWTECADLALMDTILGCNLSQLSSVDTPIDGIQSRFDAPVPCTFNATRSAVVNRASIGQYGRQPMVPSRLIAKFTTATTIHSTTNWGIWSVSPDVSTVESLLPHDLVSASRVLTAARTLRLFEMAPLHDDSALAPVSRSGTEPLGRSGSRSLASCADGRCRWTKEMLRGSDFARTPVMPHRVTERPTEAGYEPVYDLEVEGEHEFFANGLLVHNCSGYVAWAYYIGSNGSVDLRDGQSVSTASLYPKTVPVDAANAQPGDLVFYGMDQGNLANQHVAIYLGGGMVVSETQPGTGVAKTTVAAVAEGRTTEYRRLRQ